MTSTTETGHDKNVANLEDLISRCTGFGTAFNPSKAALKIPALNTLHTNGKNVIQALKVAETAFDNATNAREIAFEPLKKLSTRVINSLEVSGATKQTVADAVTINRKIQGARAKSKKALDSFIESTHKETAPETTTTPKAEPKQISVSQQSYDSLIDHLTKLIQLVTSEALYTPNENDLKVTALNTTLTSLKTTNTAVINAETTYKNALLNRNNTLYAGNTGLVDLALEVKKYVKSVFGATSPQYKQVSSIAFRKYKI